MVYCVVPRELASLVPRLEQHFGCDPGITVIVERRRGERRTGRRRGKDSRKRAAVERRRIRNPAGRRVAERRAVSVTLNAPPLPRRFKAHADRLTFVEPVAPSGRHLEDIESDRLIIRFQAGDESAFAELYGRYIDRLHAYLTVAMSDAHGAEDVIQETFVRAHRALPDYEIRSSHPLRAWLFHAARNLARNELDKRRLYTTEDPQLVRARLSSERADSHGNRFSDWSLDEELMAMIKDLPSSQRQTIGLRFIVGLSTRQAAEVMDRTQEAVRQLQSRALRSLGERIGSTELVKEYRGSQSRVAMLHPLRQVPVLRARRFALWRPFRPGLVKPLAITCPQWRSHGSAADLRRPAWLGPARGL